MRLAELKEYLTGKYPSEAEMPSDMLELIEYAAAHETDGEDRSGEIEGLKSEIERLKKLNLAELFKVQEQAAEETGEAEESEEEAEQVIKTLEQILEEGVEY